MGNKCYNCFCDTLNEYGVCRGCGYDNAANREKYPLALPAGSILYGRYIVGKVLGQGGYGITYLAQDYRTKERVAIKEFFPDTMATRTGTTTVMPLTGAKGEYFQYGRTSFLEEAKIMAEFNENPNVAEVRMYFEENGTGYYVMEYIEGTSFEEYIRNHGGRLSWEDTARVMLPVLDALEAVHSKGIIHRDVTPDNIYITNDGKVKLLDFGAARHSLGNVSQSLDVILKHGFAPKEQYSRRGKQGPYTDVYAASASIYYALTGAKPDDAIERSSEDDMPPPTVLGAKISGVLEDALLKGLAVEAKDRYQTVGEMKRALTEMPVIVDPLKLDDPVDSDGPADPIDPTGPADPDPKPVFVWMKKKKMFAISVCAALLLIAFCIFWFAHPHSYGEWEETQVATCLDTGLRERKCFCGETETETLAALGHSIVIDAAIPSTCAESGLSEGSHCSVCGTVLREQESLPTLNHEVTLLAAVAPTCETPGLTEGFGCVNCGVMEIPQQTIEATGHTPVTDAAVEATCLAEGKSEGSHCSVCNTILVEQQTLPKVDHTPVVDAAVAATCASEGKTEGSHCSVCNEVIVAQQSVAKTSHTPVTDKAVAATCASEGKTEGKHCSACGVVLTEQQSIAKLAHTPVKDNAVAATCSVEGKTEGSHCSVCGFIIQAQSVIETTGHSYSDNKCSDCGITRLSVSVRLTGDMDYYPENGGVSGFVRIYATLSGAEGQLGHSLSYEFWCDRDRPGGGGILSGSGTFYCANGRIWRTSGYLDYESFKIATAPGAAVTVKVYDKDGSYLAKATYNVPEKSYWD